MFVKTLTAYHNQSVCSPIYVKGSELNKEIRLGNRNKYRHHLLFLGSLIEIVEQNEGKLFGRIYVKPVGGAFDGTAVYTSAVQGFCLTFHNLLTERSTTGLMIADAREQKQNTKVSRSIFTEKFRFQGDKYPNLVEMPVFGLSLPTLVILSDSATR